MPSRRRREAQPHWWQSTSVRICMRPANTLIKSDSPQRESRWEFGSTGRRILLCSEITCRIKVTPLNVTKHTKVEGVKADNFSLLKRPIHHELNLLFQLVLMLMRRSFQVSQVIYSHQYHIQQLSFAEWMLGAKRSHGDTAVQRHAHQVSCSFYISCRCGCWATFQYFIFCQQWKQVQLFIGKHGNRQTQDKHGVCAFLISLKVKVGCDHIPHGRLKSDCLSVFNHFHIANMTGWNAASNHNRASTLKDLHYYYLGWRSH